MKFSDVKQEVIRNGFSGTADCFNVWTSLHPLDHECFCVCVCIKWKGVCLWKQRQTVCTYYLHVCAWRGPVHSKVEWDSYLFWVFDWTEAQIREKGEARKHGQRFHTSRLANADCLDLTTYSTRRSGDLNYPGSLVEKLHKKNLDICQHLYQKNPTNSTTYNKNLPHKGLCFNVHYLC